MRFGRMFLGTGAVPLLTKTSMVSNNDNAFIGKLQKDALMAPLAV